MKVSITKISPSLIFLGFSLVLANCANDSKFTSSSGKIAETPTGGDAVPNTPQKSAIDDGGQKTNPTPEPEAKVDQAVFSDPVEVLTPAVPLSGSVIVIADGIEVPPPKLPDFQSLKGVFPASKKITGNLSYNAAEKSFSTQIELKNQYSDEKDSFTQIKRPSITDTFKQGNPGIPKAETFNQKQLGVVDIQVVIDNSGSMGEEQDKVKTKLPDLLKHIGESNWQINVATTDPNFFNGQRQCSQEGVIKKGEADALTRFTKAISAGTNGSGLEKGILMAVEGLRCPQAGNWVRPGSKIVVLIVSDEDNCSGINDPNPKARCPGAPEESHTYLTNYLASTLGRPLITHSRVYGIYKKPGDTACTTASNPAVIYQQAVLATRDPANPGTGYEGSICDGDLGYTTTFQSISKDIATILDTSFQLANTPDLASLVVTVDSVTIPRLNGAGEPNWELDAATKKLLRFVKFVPSAAAEIKVTYTVGATTPILSEFKLSNTPTTDPAAEFIVYVNNATATADVDYKFDAASNSVKFLKLPEADADVKIVYKKAMNLTTLFKLSKPVAEGFNPAVQVNGKPEAQFTYDRKTSEITFATAPGDGSAIEVTYKSLVGPITSYDISLNGTTIKNLSITYAKNNQPVIGAKLEKNSVILSELGFVAGEKIDIKYYNETSGVVSLKLPKIPLPDSILVTSTEGTCSYMLSPARDEVTLDCTALGAKTVNIQWSYFTEAETTFSLPQVLRPDSGTWKVEIDGNPTTDFKRDGRTIVLNTPPLQTSMITVIYMEGS
jgi:hypothetical protein